MSESMYGKTDDNSSRELFETMYGPNVDDVESKEPMSVQPSRINVANMGKFNKVTIDGKDLLLVDHKWIDELATKFQRLENTNREHAMKMIKYNNTIQELQRRVQELEKNQIRYINDDY